MQTEPLELTILMPCLNEEKTVGVCVDKAMAFLQQANIVGEVLIADNGSTDNSVMLATRRGARVIAVSEKGYGAALIGGLAAAQGRYIIMGDADDSYDFSALDGFVRELRAGVDLVMGNRFRGGIAPGAMPPLHRYLGNPVLSFIGRLLYRTQIGDFHCGLRGFSRDRMRQLGLSSSGMEFASEMVMKACMAGYRITEVPTTLQPDGRGRPPHLRSWRDGLRHLKLLFAYAPDWLFLYPALVLILFSLCGFVFLLWGNLSIGSIGFGIHTLLYSGSGIFAACSMLLYYLLVRRIAMRHGWLASDQAAVIRRLRLDHEDVALVAGGILLLIGVLSGIQAVTLWGAENFGSLMGHEIVTRWTAVSVFSLLIGFQLVMHGLLVMVIDRVD